MTLLGCVLLFFLLLCPPDGWRGRERDQTVSSWAHRQLHGCSAVAAGSCYCASLGQLSLQDARSRGDTRRTQVGSSRAMLCLRCQWHRLLKSISATIQVWEEGTWWSALHNGPEITLPSLRPGTLQTRRSQKHLMSMDWVQLQQHRCHCGFSVVVFSDSDIRAELNATQSTTIS